MNEYEKKNLVVVLPDGSEYFEEVEVRSFSYGKTAVQQVAENAVRKAKLTTSRANPVKVKVKVYGLVIKQGKLERIGPDNIDVMPSLERMSMSEYGAEMKEIVAELPEEFRNYVENMAWADGHSAGYEEVINIAQSMVSSIQPVIAAYTKRIKG